MLPGACKRWVGEESTTDTNLTADERGSKRLAKIGRAYPELDIQLNNSVLPWNLSAAILTGSWHRAADQTATTAYSIAAAFAAEGGCGPGFFVNKNKVRKISLKTSCQRED